VAQIAERPPDEFRRVRERGLLHERAYIGGRWVEAVEHRDVGGGSSLGSDLRDVPAGFVIREDRGQAFADLLAPVQLAAVKPHDVAVFREQRRVRRSVLPVPGIAQRVLEI
jgi:hypothetical protein